MASLVFNFKYANLNDNLIVSSQILVWKISIIAYSLSGEVYLLQ